MSFCVLYVVGYLLYLDLKQPEKLEKPIGDQRPYVDITNLYTGILCGEEDSVNSYDL